MTRLELSVEAKLVELGQLLVNQSAARVIVPPQRSEAGHWFGGGNLIEDSQGHLYLVGRYRNRGDSRTGLGAGERGLELAIFRSIDRGRTFEKILAFSKADLRVAGCEVLSIEGSALHWTAQGVELFVSSEKAGIGYPPEVAPFLKPGCGVWTIERLQADSIEQLRDAALEMTLQSRDPQYLHVKDPVVYDTARGDLSLLFCTHPFSWTSSNTAFAVRAANGERFSEPRLDFFPRGTTWDVAITRGTCVVNVPALGAFAEQRVSLLFYDGGECVQQHVPHQQAIARPRGYSCEELGGLAYFVDGDLEHPIRLSTSFPLFTSPWGSGCSRYVDVLPTMDGFYVTWQQSQDDFSQPLVMNFVDRLHIERLLES